MYNYFILKYILKFHIIVFRMYEDAIKNYDGDDPLENWYEYILWVEQSYPKNGHESHIGKLLQQCLAIFEKETKYHQDRRYIRLWINYVRYLKYVFIEKKMFLLLFYRISI